MRSIAGLTIAFIVCLGAFYDPNLLPDYSPDHFAFIKNKLVQHDVRDIDGHLIPAWKIEEGLRPGTVVLVSATLHIYNIDNNSVPGGSFRRVGVYIVQSLVFFVLTVIYSFIKSMLNESKFLLDLYLKNHR